jgi:purine-nucleoside/S-methyl-5'-thioadenosine phosphorylase / adenosine deaminase
MIAAAGLGQIAGLRHGFFTREGGYSQGLYTSLNCGLGSGDDLATVRRNRQSVAEALGTEPGKLLSVFQIHSSTVVQATDPWDGNARPKADAIVTRRPGMAIAILTADCAPVLMADTTVGIIGAAHAGWKGAIGRVLESTIDEMERLGGHRRHIVAAVGPAIGQAAYEVGQEFYDRFLTSEPGNARFFLASDRPLHYRFDLQAYCAYRLEALGLQRVEIIRACTYTQEQRFFSYRRATHRGETDYGRQISAVMLGP